MTNRDQSQYAQAYTARQGKRLAAAKKARQAGKARQAQKTTPAPAPAPAPPPAPPPPHRPKLYGEVVPRGQIRARLSAIRKAGGVFVTAVVGGERLLVSTVPLCDDPACPTDHAALGDKLLDLLHQLGEGNGLDRTFRTSPGSYELLGLESVSGSPERRAKRLAELGVGDAAG